MLKSLLSILGIYKLYEKWLLHQVKNSEIPEHIAIILDGNRRWATTNSLNPIFGHFYGADKTEKVLHWCLNFGIKTITLYIFSTENFTRPENEIKKLMQLFEDKIKAILTDDDIHESKVHIKFIGRMNLLSEKLQKIIKKVENSTKDYTEHFLNFAIAYGGRAEIIDTTIKIAKKVKKGDLNPDDINEHIFEKNLYTSYLPNQEPDLVIRTSGEERLSGFLLYQSAYSELCFLDIFWPGVRKIDLLRAIRTYQNRKRRYGK